MGLPSVSYVRAPAPGSAAWLALPAVSDEPQSPVERRIMKSFVDDSGVGKPLSRRARHTKRSVEAYLAAGAIPRYMERLREIDGAIKRNRRQLERAYRTLKASCGEDAELFARRWEALARSWSFGELNALLDEHHFLQRFTPRRPRSRWSRINRDSAERLIAEGRMRPAGLAEVERARADGRWEAAYEGQRRATVPEDLQRELDARPRAKAFFEELSSQNRYAILFRLGDAKRPETRARRLAKFVAMLEAGEAIYPRR